MASAPFSLGQSESETFLFSVETGAYQCNSTATSGDLDLYMRVGNEPDLEAYLIDCGSAGLFSSDETCVVEALEGSSDLWIVVIAYFPVSSFSLGCLIESRCWIY